MFLEMSLCFMAYCAAIKHLLGRQLICQACLLLLLLLLLHLLTHSEVRFPQGVVYQSVSSSQGRG